MRTVWHWMPGMLKPVKYEVEKSLPKSTKTGWVTVEAEDGFPVNGRKYKVLRTTSLYDLESRAWVAVHEFMVTAISEAIDRREVALVSVSKLESALKEARAKLSVANQDINDCVEQRHKANQALHEAAKRESEENGK